MQKFLRTMLLVALFAVPFATQAQERTVLSEDFSAEVAEGWNGGTQAFAANFSPSGNISWSYASQALNGLAAGHYYADLWLEGRYFWAVTPAFDLSDLDNASLSFDLKLTAQSGNTVPTAVDSGKTVMVLARVGNGSWTKLAVWGQGDSAVLDLTAGNTLTYDLGEYVGKSNVRFAFYAANTTRNLDAVRLHLDNVEIAGHVMCLPVTNLRATQRTSNSITIAFDDELNPVAQFYRVSLYNGDEQVGESVDVQASAAKTVTFTGLEGATTYNVKVITFNSLSDYSEAATLNVMTHITVNNTLPYFNNFEDANSVAEWTIVGTGTNQWVRSAPVTGTHNLETYTLVRGEESDTYSGQAYMAVRTCQNVTVFDTTKVTVSYYDEYNDDYEEEEYGSVAEWLEEYEQYQSYYDDLDLTITYTTAERQEEQCSYGDAMAYDAEVAATYTDVVYFDNDTVYDTEPEYGDFRLWISQDGSNNTYNTGNDSKSLAYTPFSLEAGQYALSFDVQCYGEGTYDNVTVYLVPESVALTANSTFTSSTWKTICPYIAGVTAWQTRNLEFEVSADDVYYLLFYWKNDNSAGSQPPAAIDNIRLKAINCFPVPSVEVTEATGSSIAVKWTKNEGVDAQAYVVRATAGSLEFEGQVSAPDTTYTFTELPGSTTYTIAVYTVCGEGDTSLATTTTASTLCAVATLPMSIDYSTLSDLPACWDYQNGNANSNDRIAITNYDNSGIGLCFASYSTYGIDLQQYAISGEIESPRASTITVEYGTYGSDDKLYVGYSTTDNQTSSFQWSETLYSNRYAHKTYTADLPAGVKYIAFKYEARYAYRAFVYNFNLISPTCFAVSDVEVSNIGTNSATITWVDETNESAVYNVNIINGTDTIKAIGVEGTSLTIDTLQVYTTYKVEVTTDCNDGYPVDAVSATFTTLKLCPDPEQFKVSTERTSALITWQGVNVDKFYVVYADSAINVEQLNALTEEQLIVVKNANEYLVEGLQRDTEYHFYLRSVCSVGDTLWLHKVASTKALSFCNTLFTSEGNYSYSYGYNPLYYSYLTDLTYRSQAIYTEDLIPESLKGEYITGLHYDIYNVTNGSYTGSFRIRFGITDRVNYSSNSYGFTAGYGLVEDVPEVYSGSIEISTENGMDITFDQPVLYNGGNVVIEFNNLEGNSNVGTLAFYYLNTGWSSPYRAAYKYSNNSGSTSQYVPRVSFMHCEDNAACPEVTEVEVADITTTAANISWQASAGDYVQGYEIIVSDTAVLDFDAWTATPVATTTYAAANLTAGTIYNVYIRTLCGESDGNSVWTVAKAFRTLEDCRIAENIVAEVTGKGTVTLTWKNSGAADEQANNFDVLVARAELTAAQLEAAAPTASAIDDFTLVIDTLQHATDYIFYLRNVCSETSHSSWMPSNMVTTPIAMPAVINLAVENVTISTATIAWESDTSNFANETAWQVAVRYQQDSVADTVWTVVNTTEYMIRPLANDTDYYVYVRPYDAETGLYGQYVVDSFSTLANTPCNLFADGTASDYNILSTYLYTSALVSRSQIIYPAEMLDLISGKTITSLTYYVRSGAVLTNSSLNYTIALAEVENNSITGSSFNESVATTQVYSGVATIDASAQTITFTFDEPYVYNGGNLFVENRVTTSVSIYNDSYLYGVNGTNLQSIGGSGRPSSNSWSPQPPTRFMPKVTFCVLDEGNCAAVNNLAVSNITTTTADVSWMPGNQEVLWQYAYGTADQTLADLEMNTTEDLKVSLANLTRDADYVFYVRGICGAEDTADWKSVEFATAFDCPQPIAITYSDVTENSFKVTATVDTSKYENPAQFTFAMYTEGNEDDATILVADTAEFTGLTAGSVYYVKARSECGDADGSSRWSEPITVFTQCDGTIAWPFVENFSSPTTDCWTLTIADDDYYAESTYNTMYVSNGVLTFATAFTYGNLDYDRYVVSPEIVGLDAESRLDYYIGGNSSYAADTTFRLGYNATTGDVDDEGWVWQTITTGNGSTHVPAGTKYIAFRMYGSANTYYDYTLDNIKMSPAAQYTISVAAIDETMGSPILIVDGDTIAEGTITTYEGSNVRVVANAAECHTFGKWTASTDEDAATVSTTATMNFVLSSDTTLYATYSLDKYSLRVYSARSSYGTVSIEDTNVISLANIPAFTEFTVHAIDSDPEDNYVFRGWSASSTNQTDIISYDKDYTFQLKANTTLYAQFVIDSFNVAITWDDEMGTVVNAPATGKMPVNTSARFTAQPNHGYEFVAWLDANDDTLSHNAVIDTVISNDMAFTAVFQKVPFYLFVAANDETQGTVEASANTGLYETPIVITATPVEGSHYHFSHWSDGTTENPYNFILTQDTMLTAFFAIDTHKVTINGTREDLGYVTINGEEATEAWFDYGTTGVALKAVANTGVTFTKWSDDVEEAERTIDVTADVELTAQFDSTVYNVAVNYDDAEGEVLEIVTKGAEGIAAATSYDKLYQDTITLVAAAKAGFRFTNWSDDESNVYYGDTLRYVVADRANQIVAANFAEASKVNINLVAVNLSADSVAGTVKAIGTYNNVQTTTIDGVGRFDSVSALLMVATAKEHYHFVNWTNEEGEVVYTTDSVEIAHLFELESEAVYFYANFALDTHTVLIASYDEEMGSVTINDEAISSIAVTYGSTVNVKATPASHYHFVNWNDDNTNVDTTFVVEADVVLEPMFAIDVYAYAFKANYEERGSIEAEGYETINETADTAWFAYGSQATFTATAAEGYGFINWNTGETTETVTLPVYADFTVVANFDTLEYSVAVSVDAAMGSVEGPATIKHFGSATYTATAKYGYHFVNWTAGEAVLGTDAELVLQNVVSDTAFVANFDSNEYTITLAETENGTATGAATVKYLQHVTLTATPAEGYRLLNWTNAAGTVLGTAETLDIQVTADSTISANFVVKSYTITALANAEMGSVEGAKTTNHFDTDTLVAVANYGYDFVNWTNNADVVLGTSDTLIVSPVSDTTVKANFTKHTFTATVAQNEAAMGLVAVTGTATYKDTVTYMAKANAHYQFVKWTDAAGDSISNLDTLKVEVLGDMALTAYFAPIMRHVTVSVNPANTGSVNVADTMIADGQTLTIVATPAAGYRFVSWSTSEDDTIATLTKVVESDLAITANFAMMTYEITLTASPANAGTLTGAGTKQAGDTITVSATAAAGYRFVNWTEGNTVVSTSADYEFVVTGNRSLIANFVAVYTVEVQVNDNTMGSASPVTATYDEGAQATVNARANTGYHFVAWVNANNTNDTVNRNADYTFEVRANVSLIAVFAADNTGIDDVDMSNVTIFSADSKIIVRGAENHSVYVFDVNGRVINSEANASETIEFRMATTGVYLVKVGNAPAKRVLVVR